MLYLHQYPFSRLYSFTNGSPFFILSRFNRKISNERGKYSLPNELTCGLICKFGTSHNGCSLGNGSGSVTSTAAPPNSADFNEASNAS